MIESHYMALLAGEPGVKEVSSLDTWRIPRRSGEDEYDIPGTGDTFRGDWIDVVNYFYMAVIQEHYHIGKRNVRTSTTMRSGNVHLGKYTLVGPNGEETVVSVPDFATGWQAESERKSGQIMLVWPMVTKASVPAAGEYQMRIAYKSSPRSNGSMNIYANGALASSLEGITGQDETKWNELDGGNLTLKEGENEISFDIGAISAEWSDGTIAEWTTPYLRKGFKTWNGDVVFAVDYDRMWSDTWSGNKKIHFFSWEGTDRTWKLPQEWRGLEKVTLHPLTPTGWGEGISLEVKDGSVAPILLSQIPYILVL